ncbi:hypothetical protein [uncultured Sphingosinicella sp.]|uniref:hypothetical protein n=1 Tax=uncultured Sphingosinicella sp. TaxID=478748 RepID=UPI0030DACE45
MRTRRHASDNACTVSHEQYGGEQVGFVCRQHKHAGAKSAQAHCKTDVCEGELAFQTLGALDAETRIKRFPAPDKSDGEAADGHKRSSGDNNRKSRVAGFPNNHYAARDETDAHDQRRDQCRVDAAHKIHIDPVEHGFCPWKKGSFHTLLKHSATITQLSQEQMGGKVSRWGLRQG